MFDTVTGLPVHALVVHAVVVLVPLAAFGLIVVAVRPSWRRAYAPIVALLATAGLALVPVATRSGGKLEERLDAGGVVARQINDHQELGELVLWPTLAMWVLAVALVFLDRRRDGSKAATTAVAVLAVIAAVAAAGLVSLAGHRGSTAVWSCTIGSDACE
jgi:uncharacterized membrane protein